MSLTPLRFGGIFTDKIPDQKKTYSLYYRPYSYFAHVADSEVLPGESVIAVIEGMIQQRRYHQARLQAKELIEHTLEGLRYLQT